MKKNTFFLIAVLILVVIFTAGCSSLKSGAREGVRDGVSSGIAGMFGGGSGSGGSSSSSSGGASTAPERDYSGRSQTVPWPSDRDWRRYGLEGFKQPAGTDVIKTEMMNLGSGLYGAILGSQAQGQVFTVELINGGKRAYENLLDQVEAFGATEDNMSVDSDSEVRGYSINNEYYIQLSVDLLNGDIGILASNFRFY